MGRVCGRLFTLAAAVSAVLGVGVCGLWVRSYWRADWVADRGPAASRSLFLFKGRASYAAFPASRTNPGGTGPNAPGTTAGSASVDDFVESYLSGPPAAAFPGFVYVRGRPARGEPFPPRLVRVDAWLVLAAAAIPAAAWVGRRAARARRVKPGACRRCGYDLRATPGEGGALLGRCPECGAIPSTPAAGEGAAA